MLCAVCCLLCAGCCVLFAVCWVLGAGCWVLGAGCCVLCAVEDERVSEGMCELVSNAGVVLVDCLFMSSSQYLLFGAV